jgi:hypothetical protein
MRRKCLATHGDCKFAESVLRAREYFLMSQAERDIEIDNNEWRFSVQGEGCRVRRDALKQKSGGEIS